MKYALLTENGGVTYDQLEEMVNNAMKNFYNREIAFIITDNNLESIVYYIGCLKKRIVPLLLHKNLPLKSLVKMIENYNPYYIILPQKLEFRYSGYYELDAFETYRVYYKKYGKLNVIYPELALLLSTSGSIGSAKCVRISYDNLRANTLSICEALRITGEDMAITTLPMDYTYGLSIINTHLYKHACVVLNTTSIIYRAFWNKIKKYNCTTMGGVPYTYEVMNKLNLLENLKCFNYITQAGGRLDPIIAKKIAELCKKAGVKFIIMYGQTEATARISYLPWEYIEGKWDSIGIPIPGGNMYVIDEQGNRIEKYNTEGEIVYRGSNVTMGYAYSKDDLVKGDERNGILKTGDIGYYDEKHFFYVTGRKKRFIKMYGNRVNLDELERRLREEGYSILCVGKDDNLVIIFENQKINLHIKNKLHLMGIPVHKVKIVEITKRPLNSSNKTDYFKLEQMFL